MVAVLTGSHGWQREFAWFAEADTIRPAITTSFDGGGSDPISGGEGNERSTLPTTVLLMPRAGRSRQRTMLGPKTSPLSAQLARARSSFCLVATRPSSFVAMWPMRLAAGSR